MKKLAMCFVLFVLLAACDNPWLEYRAGERDALVKGWYARENPPGLVPIYCYKTLAELECFDKPRENDERQAVWTYRAADR